MRRPAARLPHGVEINPAALEPAGMVRFSPHLGAKDGRPTEADDLVKRHFLGLHPADLFDSSAL